MTELVKTRLGRTRSSKLAALERKILYERLKPVPRLTVCQWADRYRVLSPEASFRAGQYSSDDAPYQKEFMDVCGDPRHPHVVGMWGSQLGKTETLNNVAGYYMDQDPSPILMLQPTKEMAEAWSKDRLAPMLRDTPRLKDKVADARSRDSGNTILHKTFAGGHLTIVGSNSAAGLASRPIRVLLRDEIDRYAASAGAEGDPRAISESRTSTFPNKKIIDVSSPTVEDGPIGKAYTASDQREYFVPCPHCGHEQKLEFGGKDTSWGIKWDQGKPETAHYVCRACAAVIEEADKMLMLKRGRWIAQNAESPIPGFKISALYSPFFRWSELVARFLRDKEDPLKLQSFVNTILCEFWVEGGEQVDEGVLEEHKSPFPRGNDPDSPQMIVPHGVGALTRSVDVQGDRLETTVWGWGKREEAWRVDFELIPGDPATKEPWDELHRIISRPYLHESGATVNVLTTFIDAGGHHAQQVYDFARKHARQRVFAIKGSSLQEGVPFVSPPKRHKSARIVTYQVGSYTGKEALMKRLLKVKEPGPFYIHLPDDIDQAHVEQFLNEKLMRKIVAGRPRGIWVRTGPNEQIDLFVYALAALHSLGPLVIDKLEARAKELSEWKSVEKKAAEEDPLALLKRRGKRNWVNDWKDK
jgi:phage terminase large subunit GpA-like protein